MFLKFCSLCHLIMLIIEANENNYGSFDLSISKFDLCKGPKSKDCSNMKVVIDKNVLLKFDTVITRDIAPTMGKVVAMSNGKQLVRLQMNKPCEHLFMRPLLDTIFNISRNCVIQKGHYMFEVDVAKIAKSYFGGTFLYGNLSFKSIFYGNDCNLACSVINVVLSPTKPVH